MRSIGGPQTIWALESHMDTHREQAQSRSVGISHGPFAQARRNVEAGCDGDGRRPASREQAAVAPLDWQSRSSSKSQGAGVAVGVSDSEAMPVSVALVRLLADGSVILLAGTTEVGQGARTILSQIVARGIIPADRPRQHEWHRHVGHAVRPLHRRQPVDDRDGQRRQSRRRGFAQSIDSSRGRSLSTRVRNSIELSNGEARLRQ